MVLFTSDLDVSLLMTSECSQVAQSVELDLGVILSSEQTGLEDVLLGQEVDPLLLLNGAERGLHVALAIRL